MTSTPLLDRINARKPQPPEPVKLTDRMSPFMRRLAEKNLRPVDQTARIYDFPRTGDAA